MCGGESEEKRQVCEGEFKESQVCGEETSVEESLRRDRCVEMS